VVGGTGAGKSSLMNALLRINGLSEGKIEIDGVDISLLGLRDLRSRFSIIPQDPVLFQGTIRKNLDPFSQTSDEDFWNSLKISGYIKSDEDIEGHKFHLDAVVEDEGSNFSLGERQLIALARALVRQSKILILDEATSSVDYETDSFVQQTIAKDFKNCTVLCIAHRLNTVINYDKMLVLEQGIIEEYGEPGPYALWSNESRFREMCSSAGIVGDDFTG
jgi:ABC-type multidrug transport system fused ATPase/permease subunit